MFQFAKMMVVLVSFSVASLPLDTTKDLMFQYCWYRTCIDLISHVSRRFPTAFSFCIPVIPEQTFISEGNHEFQANLCISHWTSDWISSV